MRESKQNKRTKNVMDRGKDYLDHGMRQKCRVVSYIKISTKEKLLKLRWVA